jgi:hypothetical protein
VNNGATDRPPEPGWYEIRLGGQLTPRWSAWLDGMDITPDTDGNSIVRGPVADQAALHGLLSRLRDIGIPLISVAMVEPGPALHPCHHPDAPTGD